MILRHELKLLNDINCKGPWMTSTTTGCELKVVDAIKNLGLWIR